MKWLAPLSAYLAVGIGLLGYNSAWVALLGFHFVIAGSLFVARPNIPLAILFESSDIRWVVLSVILCGSIGKVHIRSIFFALVVLILAGWFWRQVVREYPGLLAPVPGHMAADFSILVAVYRMSA